MTDDCAMCFSPDSHRPRCDRELVLARLIDAPREKHDQMGFHPGWSESLDRLVAIVARTS